MMTTLKCSLAPLLLVLSACGDPPASPQQAAPERPKQAAPAPAPAAPAVPAEITEAKGVDLTRLTEAQKTSFFQILNSEASACGKPHSLAVSLRDDPACRDSLIVSQYIADGLAAGASASDLKASIEPLVDTLRPRDINIEGRPVHGDPGAKVTVVVFADFECAHCRQEAPALRQAIDQSGGKVKLVYKHFPLKSNLRSKAAAIATVAAMEQGKFWEMHDIVFAHQTALADADLRGYARKIGLDMAKFDASYAAKRGEALVDADRAEGETLKISGTPAVYVDGRRMHGSLFGGTLAGWIDDALRR
jgi:protein-disulfide isomerase